MARERLPQLSGAPTGQGWRQRDGWLRYEVDAIAGAPSLLVTYPSALAQAGGYIAKQVKLEFGALTDQQPGGAHSLASLLAEMPGVDLKLGSRSCCSTTSGPGSSSPAVSSRV